MSEDAGAAQDPGAESVDDGQGSAGPGSDSSDTGSTEQASGGDTGGGLLSAAGDLLDSVVSTVADEAGGVVLDPISDVVHGAEGVVDAGRALYDAATGDSQGAEHQLHNLVADGFESIPGHELGWDAMAGLGWAIDGSQNEVKTWEEGGAEQFRDGVGADPEHESAPSLWPEEPEVQEA